MSRVRVFSLCLLLSAVAAQAQQVRQVEYFLDTDPGYGLGAVLSNLTIGANELTFDLTAAKDGAHVLYVRSQDDTGLWSTTMSRPLFIDRYQDIVYAEYFYDDADPGRGMATPLPLPDVAYKGHLEWTALFDVTGLALGQHTLTVRALDRYDQWTDEMTRPFTIVEKGGDNPPDNPPLGEGDLARLEYFFDTDPGYGQGRPLSTPSTGTNTYVMSFDGVQPGAHVLCLRAQNNQGRWSTVVTRPLYVYQPSGKVLALEYFFDDDDPGEGRATAVTLPQNLLEPFAFDISVNGLPAGMHHLCVRAKGDDGQWSLVSREPFIVAAPSEIARGDVNADGEVGIGDIVAVTNVMADTEDDAATIQRADVNGDGEVGIGDIVAITNIMAGNDD